VTVGLVADGCWGIVDVMRLSTTLKLIVALIGLVAGAARAQPTTTTTTTTTTTEQVPIVVDEGLLLERLGGLFDKADVARVVVVVDDTDERRRRSLERSLVRVMRDRRREDVVTPALVRARLGAAAASQLDDTGVADTAFAADHVLVAAVVSEGGRAVLALRLIVSATGAVVGTARVDVDGAAAASTASVQDIRAAAADIADVVAEAVEGTGAEVKTQRIAVPPAAAEGAALTARLDRFVATELTAALRARGFLVVERAALQTAMGQLSLAQLTGTDDAGALGKVLGAQSLLLAQVAEAGTSFVVTARLLDVETGVVLTASSASIRRDDVVALADVETRTPAEAAIRSAVVPGWGQAENGDGGKAVLFGVATYGALATTIGLGVLTGLTAAEYRALAPSEQLAADKVAERAVALREQANGLAVATAVAGGVTAVVWALNVTDALVSGD